MLVSFISLGCAKNQVDLEFLIAELASIGCTIEQDIEKCDAVIINTCGFIESAVKEAIDNILSASKEIKDGAKLIVTGCMAERYINDIKSEMPEIDFVCGVGNLSQVTDYIKKLMNSDKVASISNRVIANYPYFAYLKISEGCNNRCTYCTIPSIRGNLVCRDIDDVVKEAKYLVSIGVKEIVIISQDTTKYPNLLELLAKLAKELPSTFFRLLYLNPDGVTDELIKFIAKNDNFIKYFEIPVQHASDDILKAMNRKSNYETITKVFTNIKNTMPNAFIRTTFIVGFPNESDSDFKILKEFITEYKPDFAGFFPYSKEDGTPAAKLDNQIDAKVVAKRIKELQTLQKKNTLARLKGLKESSFLAFAEKANDEFEFILEGRAIFQAPEIDGKLYVTDGIANNGYGPYKCMINKIAYPDIYVTILEEN